MFNINIQNSTFYHLKIVLKCLEHYNTNSTPIYWIHITNMRKPQCATSSTPWRIGLFLVHVALQCTDYLLRPLHSMSQHPTRYPFILLGEERQTQKCFEQGQKRNGQWWD